MTDSPRLEEVLAAVLAEHREQGEWKCSCGYVVPWGVPGTRIDSHVAERLAARLLAHRGLLLEALGGERMEHRVQRELVEVLWRFPVSEEAQK